jgi:hypothetical protein
VVSSTQFRFLVLLAFGFMHLTSSHYFYLAMVLGPSSNNLKDIPAPSPEVTTNALTVSSATQARALSEALASALVSLASARLASCVIFHWDWMVVLLVLLVWAT